MERPLARSYDELNELRELVRIGKLFQVQEWTQAGKPVYCSAKSKKRSVLEIAARSGFYSIVELLAREHPDRDTLNGALDGALRTNATSIGSQRWSWRTSWASLRSSSSSDWTLRVMT